MPADWVGKGWASLGDEFRIDDGQYEEHYATRVDRLQAERFVVE